VVVECWTHKVTGRRFNAHSGHLVHGKQPYQLANLLFTSINLTQLPIPYG